MALNSLFCADVPLSNYSLRIKVILWAGQQGSTSGTGNCA